MLSTMQADVRPLHPGDPLRIGVYHLLGRLGEGGQGCVYLGRAGIGPRVAVKALHAAGRTGRGARRRLAAEAEALGRILPFFTARLVEARVRARVPYLVTAFIDGPSLHQQVTRHGPLAEPALERLAAGTLTALIAVHDAELVHHDVKPGNVLLGPDRPRLIDFGAAAAAGIRSPGARSRDGVLTTPAFMSPELLGPGEITPAADLFSWASTMAFAATGRGPFQAPDQARLLQRIEHDDPDLDGIPDTLRPVLGACLVKEPTARPTAAGALDQLLRSLGLGSEAAPSPATPDGGTGTRPGPVPGPGRAGAARQIWDYSTVPLQLPA